MSIHAYDSPSFWYNLSSNNEVSLCQLLLLEECIFHSVLVKCGLIRDILVQNKIVRRNIYFIRIGNKNNTSFVKVFQQCKSSQHPPLINTCNISRIFLSAIKDDIFDSISWNDCLLNKNLEKSDVQICKPIIESKSTTTIIDNPPLPSSSYLVLDSLSIETTDLESNPFRVINLKNILKEVNGIELNIDSWGGRGKKKIIKIPSFGHLRYDRFKQNLKNNNFVSEMLEALSNNVKGNISSSLINLCHYIAEFYEEEYISAAGDSGLTLSGSMSAIETTSMVNVVGINISQLRILHRILRHKFGVKLFEPKSKMVGLCGEMIVPQFGEYKYIHEIGSKPELI